METNGEVISMPVWITNLFQMLTITFSPWNAIEQLRHELRQADTYLAQKASQDLKDVARDVHASTHLFPPLLDYALWHSDLDDNKQVVLILIKNGYEKERFLEEIDAAQFAYKVTLVGSPSHFIWHNRTYNVESPTMYFREPLEQLNVMSWANGDVPPIAAIGKAQTTQVTVKRWGWSVQVRDLKQANPDGFISEFGRALQKAILSGEAFDVKGV